VSRRALPMIALLALVAGCGRASEPAAPKAAVDTAVTALSSRCGVALELRAYGRDSAQVRVLDAQSGTDAAHLIGTARALPDAIYLGQSMRDLLATEASALQRCGLVRTAARLATARP